MYDCLRRSKFLFLLSIIFNLSAGEGAAPQAEESLSPRKFISLQFHTFMRDMADVNKEVFTSLDTMKFLTWIFPVYLICRFSDDQIHEAFYEPALHKNISQLPDAFYHFTSKGVTALAVLLLVAPLFEFVDADVRRTSVLMAKGLLSIFAVRSFVKYSLRARASLRPWSEPFSRHERVIGGFPSGHMAMISYLATLYGLQFGPSWGFPLSIFGAAACFASLNHNRHYASQLVGGIGLGMIYGYAAHKVLEYRPNEDWNVNFDLDAQMRPNLSLSYEF